MAAIKKIMRNGVIVTGLKSIQSIVLVLFSVICARLLGPDGFGVYSFGIALVTLLSVPVANGLCNLVNKELIEAMHAKSWEHAKGILRWSYTFVFLYSILTMIILSIVIVTFGLIDSPLAVSVLLAMGLLPLLGLMGGWSGAFRAYHLPIYSVLSETVLRPIFLLVGLGGGVALNFQFSSSEAIILNVAATLFVAIIIVILHEKVKPTEIKNCTTFKFRTKSWFFLILPLSASAGLLLLNRQVDLLIVGFLLRAEDVGIYRVGTQGSILTTFGIQAASTVVVSYFVRNKENLPLKDIHRFLGVSILISILVAIPCLVFFVVAGKQLIGLIFGVEYLAGYIPLVILSLGNTILAFNGASIQLLNMRGFQHEVLRIFGWAIIANVIMNFVLVPRWGIDGAAFASTISIVIWSVLLRNIVVTKFSIYPLSALFESVSFKKLNS